MVLGKRLSKILERAGGDLVCDVGCDHGYLAIALVNENKAKRVIASDLREGPLLKALDNVSAAGLEEKIELIKADGIVSFKDRKPDCIVIAGMGGPLIERILTEGAEVPKNAKLVLSPQSHIPDFRSFLWDNGYRIDYDGMVKDEGKYYTIIEANYYGSPISYSYKDTLIGMSPDPDCADVLREYVQMRISQIQSILLSVPEGERRNLLIRESEVLGEYNDGKGNI